MERNRNVTAAKRRRAWRRVSAVVVPVVVAVALGGDSPSRRDYRKRMEERGLVDIQRLDRTVLVRLMYADTANFLHTNLYGSLRRCYVQEQVAPMLLKARDLARLADSSLDLLILDCARPRDVQNTMWQHVRGTDQQKYVVSPLIGSMHNYGAAVDVTLVDSSGAELDMGTPVDHFGPEAEPQYEKKLLEEGTLTREQVDNRLRLRRAMVEAGFRAIRNEWWHFDAFPRDSVEAWWYMID